VLHGPNPEQRRLSFLPLFTGVHRSAWKKNSAKLDFRFTEFSEIRTNLGPPASCLWGKGSSRPEDAGGASESPRAEEEAMDAGMGGGGEHYPDRNACGCCYDGTASSKENTLIGEKKK
jgi:hypothetical protein